MCQLGDGARESISPYPSQVPGSDKVPSLQTKATTHLSLSSTGIQKKNTSINFFTYWFHYNPICINGDVRNLCF